MSDWVSVYSFGKQHEAEMAVECLIDNGIEAVIMNKKDSAYLFGDIEVYAKQENVILAKHLINKLLGFE